MKNQITPDNNYYQSSLKSVVQDTMGFLECISSFAKSLSSHLNLELQDLFLKYASSNNKLPDDADSRTIDDFVSILITMITSKHSHELSVKAFSIFYTFIRNDQNVFSRFKPSISNIKKINIAQFLSSSDYNLESLALDFCCFIMRSYPDADYSLFSTEENHIAKIRKAEIRRTWVDIEDLAKSQEAITKVLYQFQQSTTNAYSQMMTAIEEEKKANSKMKEVADSIVASVKGEIDQFKRQVLQTQEEANQFIMSQKVLNDSLNKKLDFNNAMMSETEKIIVGKRINRKSIQNRNGNSWKNRQTICKR
jgi:hypothetical protein